MKITQLRLKSFRNVQETVLKPNPNLNFLVGENGQGKTSLIEAIGYLATLRSFRESKTANVIQWGAERSEIICSLESGNSHSIWKTELKLLFHLVDPARKKATKSAFINGKTFKSSTQYLTQRFGSVELGFHTVVFNPSDHDLVRGDPGIRRSYLDQVIAAQNVEYLTLLQKYNRIVTQRNRLLKDALLKKESFTTSPYLNLFSSFTEQLCAYGSVLTLQRMKWIDSINPFLTEMLFKIAPEQMPVSISYCPIFLLDRSFSDSHFTGQDPSGSLKLLEQLFRDQAVTVEAAERKVGYSLFGPHRDDWTFLLGDQVLKGHGSQGEVRSALLALKLAEIVLFQKATGHRPLFLLDDFSSELDQKRRSFLLEFLKETDLQTFVTTTDDSSLPEKKFWISKGRVEKET